MTEGLILTKHHGRWHIACGSDLIPILRVVMLVLALFAFLYDFVTPYTPTPIAVVDGKMVPQPPAVAVLVASPASLTGAAFVSLEVVVAPWVGRRAGVLDLTCNLRC